MRPGNQPEGPNGVGGRQAKVAVDPDSAALWGEQ